MNGQPETLSPRLPPVCFSCLAGGASDPVAATGPRMLEEVITRWQDKSVALQHPPRDQVFVAPPECVAPLDDRYHTG